MSHLPSITAAPATPARLGRLVTPDHLWPLAVLACLFAFVSTHPIRPHDFWWHLKIGQQIAVNHHIPQVDTFSYTMPGQPYPSYNVYWLADLALYAAYALGGPAASVFAHAVLIAGTYLLLYLLCLRLSRNARVATIALLLAAALGFENWNLRPQAVTFLLFTLYLWLTYAFRTNPKLPPWAVAGFPLLMLVWVNSHGSFPLGIVLLGMWLVETAWERHRIGPRAWRQLWPPVLALLLTAAATLLNPQGVGIFAYLRAMQGNAVVQHLPEWAPASFATKDGIAFFVLAALGLGLILWAGRARSGLWHWLLLLAFALLAWRTGRAIVWFGLVLAPIVAELLPQVLPRRAEPQPIPSGKADRAVLAVLMLCFVGLMIVSLPWFKGHLPLPEKKRDLISLRETPVRVVTGGDLAAYGCQPNLFHDMGFGSFLIWHHEGPYRVFADPRIELYPSWLWDIYHLISRGGPGWEHYLRVYGVNCLLLSEDNQPGLVRAARASPVWEETGDHQSTGIVMFRRRGTPVRAMSGEGAGR